MEPFPQSNHLFDDVRRRTHNTIMFYDGEPVAVYYISGIDVHVYTFEEALQARAGMGRTIPYTDVKLVDRIPVLGYVNVTGGRAMFVARHTTRTQRCGLPTECLFSHDSRFVDSRVFHSAQFREMLLNLYPSIERSLDIISSKQALVVAFSKTYAIDGNKNIFHRGRLLGKLVPHKTMPGCDIEYHSSVARHSFYERNFKARFDEQLRELKVP